MIWTLYTALVGIIKAVAIWVNQGRFYASPGYDWLALLMPLEVWAAFWLLVAIAYLIGLLFVHHPQRATKWFRRQITLHAILQGILWMGFVSAFAIGSVTSLTAVVQLPGPFVGSVYLLTYGRFYTDSPFWYKRKE